MIASAAHLKTGSTPSVSVVMSVYNAEPYLHGSLSSICDQTFEDFECVLVDDGSTDHSLAILQQWAARDSRLRIISRPNTGIVQALNEGVQAARGRYIARMDADDQCASTRFQLQIERLEQENNLVAIGTGAIAIDPSGRRLGMAPVPLTHEQINEQLLQGISCIYHSAVMMRRDALEKVGGYRDLCPAEDFDLWLRLGEVGCLANLPQPLLIWRRTTSGLVASSMQRRQRAIAKALADAWQRRGLPGTPPQVQQEITSRSDLYRQWGWIALQQHERSTSRHYAMKALLQDPLSIESWRLAVCAARGY